MSERLLNLYWNILLTLLLGDAVVGVMWHFRYHDLLSNLKSDLKAKLDTDYGRDPLFRVSFSLLLLLLHHSLLLTAHSCALLS